jgi:hypothetical protein
MYADCFACGLLLRALWQIYFAAGGDTSGAYSVYPGCEGAVMRSIAGVTYPCFDCKLSARVCRKRVDIQRQVFFSIGSGRKVSCCDYEEKRYHGLEGVPA